MVKSRPFNELTSLLGIVTLTTSSTGGRRFQASTFGRGFGATATLSAFVIALAIIGALLAIRLRCLLHSLFLRNKSLRIELLNLQDLPNQIVHLVLGSLVPAFRTFQVSATSRFSLIPGESTALLAQVRDIWFPLAKPLQPKRNPRADYSRWRVTAAVYDNMNTHQ